jgi:hypothetical protein
MAEDRVRVNIHSGIDPEDLFFKKEDEKLIQNLRKKTAKEADDDYREKHMSHCFRCGTKSLVEVDRGDIKIDICANENCGAVHLDPGELEQILKDKKSITLIRKCFISVFK